MFKGVLATCWWILYRFKHFNSTFHQTEREFTCVEFMLIQNLLSLHRIFGACEAVDLPTIFSRARRVDLFYDFRGKSKRDRLSQSPSLLISDSVPVVGPSPRGGGGTWVFFGWICAARDSKLAPRSKKVSPKTDTRSRKWANFLHPVLEFALKQIPRSRNGPIFYSPFQKVCKLKQLGNSPVFF